MKPICYSLYYLKICLIPIFFELAIIISEVAGEANHAHLLVYLTFTFLSIMCFIYKNFIMQVVGLLVVVLIEGILINNQKFILNYFNNNFETKLSSRNTVDNFLLCVFFQMIAFIVALIIVLVQRKKNADNDDENN